MMSKNPPCAHCGGPHPFDTTLPSVVWNAVIRGRNLPDYLCLTCIVQEFAARGDGFTATLWGGPNEFNGLPIEVLIDGYAAQDAAKLSNENAQLRVQLQTYEQRESPLLQCIDCKNTESPAGAMARMFNRGRCLHCGGFFKVVRA